MALSPGGFPLFRIVNSSLGWNQFMSPAFARGDLRLRGFIRLKGQEMSERGTKFLEAWIVENIDSSSCPDDDSGIAALAAKCIADAQAVAITIGEIEQDAGPIEDCILEAMEEAADAWSSHVAGGGRLG